MVVLYPELARNVGVGHRVDQGFPEPLSEWVRWRKRHEYTGRLDPAGNPYINQTFTTLDDGTQNAAQMLQHGRWISTGTSLLLPHTTTIA